MFYVLKYTGPMEMNFLEYFYDEVVSVENRVALVNFLHNKNALLGKQFVELGMVKDRNELPALLQSGGGIDELIETKPVEPVQVKQEPKPYIKPAKREKKFNFEILE